MEGKLIGGVLFIVLLKKKGEIAIMESSIAVGLMVHANCQVTKEGNKAQKPKGFKEQIEEAAMKKEPKNMTLVEYRQYLSEKIREMVPPGAAMEVTVCFSDMALVAMKTDPECEKMVLQAIRYDIIAANEDESVHIDIGIRHMQERREKKNRQLELLLKKKRLKIWYEKRKIQRENYTNFLETGERYATPCPAVEALAMAAQKMGGFF